MYTFIMKRTEKSVSLTLQKHKLHIVLQQQMF